MSGRAVARRVAVAFATLAAVVVFDFFLFRTLGDPAKDLIRGRLPVSVREAIIHQRGYDQSTLTQFWLYLKALAHGDLGTSNTSEQSVVDELKIAIPNTLLLLGLSTVLSMIIGTRLGVISAWFAGKTRDTAIGQTSLALYSMPDFWLGMIFVGVFAGSLAWLPGGLKSTPGGAQSGFEYWRDVATHLILPTLTLTLGELGQYVFITRAAVADVMDCRSRHDGARDRIAAARGAQTAHRPVRAAPDRDPDRAQLRLRPRRRDHGRGAVLVARGRASLTIQAIQNKDFPMLQGIFLVTSAMVIFANLAADLLYSRLDPRVRTE